MYKRIMVALDGSETSQRALQHAVAVAAQQQAQLRLVYVIDELAFNLEPTYTPQDFWKAARKAGEHVLEGARKHAADAGVEPELRLLENRAFGAARRRVAELIVEEAARWPADLLVIGTHGRRGLSRVVLGGVAEGVLRLATVPVLLIRGTDSEAKPPPA